MDANSFKKPINERVKLAFFLLRAFAGCLEAAFLVGTGEENLKLNISFLRPAGPVKGIGNRWAGIYIVGVAKRFITIFVNAVHGPAKVAARSTV